MKHTLLWTLTTIMTFIAPIYGVILLTVLMTGLDTILGVYTTIKLNGFKSVKSHKFFNFFVKIFFGFGALVAAFIADKFIFNGQLFGINNILSKGVAIFYTYMELKSIDEKVVKLGFKSLWVQLGDLKDKLFKVKKDLNDLTN